MGGLDFLYNKKRVYSAFFFFSLFVFMCLFLGVVSASFELNGSVYDIHRAPMGDVNVTILIRDSNWAQVWYNSTLTNSSGWFNISMPANSDYMYQLSLVHKNSSFNYVDYVGQSLPLFPYSEFSQLSDVSFYLKEAGTINITAINSSGDLIPFAYQVKDTKLGFPISSANSDSNGVLVHVPLARNYSVMIYPREGSNARFVPVSFEWNNFSSSSSYSFGLSSYNVTTKTVNKMFNLTEQVARVSGYISKSGIDGWDEFTVVPLILEPGDMVYMQEGILPYNISSWNNASDHYNLNNGFYNISVFYYPEETVRYLLFASARNASIFYGGYRNISVTGDINLNFSMYGMLGDDSIINMSNANGGDYIVNCSKNTFYLIDSNSNILSTLSAHIEVLVDYSDYNATEFTFIEEISPQGYANFSIPLLNITGIKEINIYSTNYAPRRISKKSVAEILANSNLTLTSFDPGDIQGSLSDSDIYVSIYSSNSSCNVPNPSSGCVITSSLDLNNFKPINAIVGGGKLNFMMGTSNIRIYYINVDMLASGPPDGLFDNSASEQVIGDSFSSTLRFGSKGPNIYDYVLVSIPYSETPGSGLDDSRRVNMSVPLFYDDDWNIIWNVSANGSSATNLANNYTHYLEHKDEWAVLMNKTSCVGNVNFLNSTNPCYIDTQNNELWIRLPHFSGSGPDIDGFKKSPVSGGAVSSPKSASYWRRTYDIGSILEEGSYISLAIRERVKVFVSNEYHFVGVENLKEGDSVNIIIFSLPIYASLKVGEEKKFDINDDGFYDILLRLDSIEAGFADLFIKEIYEKVSSGVKKVQEIKEEREMEEERLVGLREKEEKEFSSLWYMLFILLVVVVVYCISKYLDKKKRKFRVKKR